MVYLSFKATPSIPVKPRIQVVEVTPDMDISQQIASGETHHPVLQGKTPKDVHWYVALACDLTAEQSEHLGIVSGVERERLATCEVVYPRLGYTMKTWQLESCRVMMGDVCGVHMRSS